jgi:hypothetical protein
MLLSMATLLNSCAAATITHGINIATTGVIVVTSAVLGSKAQCSF